MKSYPRKLFDAIASCLIKHLFKKKITPTEQDYRKKEFSTSTRKIGLAFTKRVRNYFRRKWLGRTDDSEN